MNNHLVILGGMGPQASIRLHELIIEKAADRLANFNDYPCILHASLAVPDTIASNAAEDATVRMINQVCSELPLKNLTAIGIACNTMHLFIDRLEKLPRAKFVSIIEAVADDAAAAGAKQVGLLASPLTVESGLYQRALATCDIDVLTPSSAEMKRLNSVVHEIVAGATPAQFRPILNKIAARLEQRGADTILLGCTELPLVGVDSEMMVLDSLDSLARAMLKRRLDALS
jgi:aspartate racemase